MIELLEDMTAPENLFLLPKALRNRHLPSAGAGFLGESALGSFFFLSAWQLYQRYFSWLRTTKAHCKSGCATASKVFLALLADIDGCGSHTKHHAREDQTLKFAAADGA